MNRKTLTPNEIETLETRILAARILLIIEKVYRNSWNQINSLLRLEEGQNSDLFKSILGIGLNDGSSGRGNITNNRSFEIILLDVVLDGLTKLEYGIGAGGEEEEMNAEDALVWIMFITSYLSSIELLHPLAEHKEYSMRLMAHMFSIYEWHVFGDGAGGGSDNVADLCCNLIIALNRSLSQDPNRVMLSIMLYLKGISRSSSRSSKNPSENEDENYNENSSKNSNLLDEETKLILKNASPSFDLQQIFADNFQSLGQGIHRLNVMEALLNQLNDMGYPNQMDTLPWLLKLLQDMITNESVANALYVNDIKILVDIILRELAALPCTEPAVNDYLCLLENVLLSPLWIQYAEFYRKEDVSTMLLSFREQAEDSPESLGDNKETISFLVETILEETADYL